MSDNPEMPEGEPKYEPPEEEIKDVESRMTDEEKEMSEKRELQPNPESFEMLALECEQVRTLAEAYSQKTGEPVVVLCNGSAGTIYHIGIDSVSTQFNRQMAARVEEGQDRESFIYSQREEFAKDWQKNLQETRESWPKDLPLTKSRKVALIKTAKDWMDNGRLDFLAVPEIDIRISSLGSAITKQTKEIVNAYSLVFDEHSRIFIDWAEMGNYFSGTFSNIEMGKLNKYIAVFSIGNSNENELYFGTGKSKDLKENIVVHNPQDWLHEVMTQIPVGKRRFDLAFSPMHTPRGENKERQYEAWRSKRMWLVHWPAGINYKRASRVKESSWHHEESFVGSRRLSLFSEESDDTEERIRKYNQAMRDAVHSIRELQVDENSDNYFQRQKKYKI